MPAFLHDGCGVENAVEAAVTTPVQAVAFLVRGVDGDRSASCVAGELGRAGEARDVADLGDQDGCGVVADPGDRQQVRCQRGDEVPDRGVQVADPVVQVGYLRGHAGEDLADVPAQGRSGCERGQRGQALVPGEVSGGAV